MNEANASNTEKAFRGLRQIGSAQLLTQLVSWSLTAVTVHILHPRDYGLLAVAGIFTSFAQLLLDGGLAPVLISQRELPVRLQGAAITAILLVSSVLCAGTWAIAPIGSSFFRSPALKAILEVSAFYLPLTALGVVPRAQLSKRMQFERLAGARIISGVAQGVFTLALAYLGARYWALIIGAFIGMALQVALFWVNLDERPAPNLRLNELRPLIPNCCHMIGQRLSQFFIGNLDTFILGRVWGPVVLGTYSVARQFAHSVHEKTSGVTTQVSVPAFAAKAELQDQVRGLIAVVSLASTLFFPLFWITSVLSPLALPLIFGTRWIRMVVPFAVFSSYLPLRTIYTLVNSSLVGTGRTGLILKNSLSWMAIIVPFMLLGVLDGADGVAIGWAAAFPIVFYVAMRRTAKALTIDVSTLLRPILWPAVSAIGSVTAAECVFLSLSQRLPVVVVLVTEGVLAGVCYPLLLRRLSNLQYQEVILFVRRVMRPRTEAAVGSSEQ